MSKNVLERVGKTFVEAFLSVLIPQVTALLLGTLPESLDGWKVLLVPTMCAALASGISAAWNIAQEELRK